MNATKFEQIAAHRIAHCRKVMSDKGEEYSRNFDRLHNFRTAASIDGETPERALWGMMKKHIVSVRDMVDDSRYGIRPTQEQVDEKITDMINYSLLLEGLFVERMEEGRYDGEQAGLRPVHAPDTALAEAVQTDNNVYEAADYAEEQLRRRALLPPSHPLAVGQPNKEW